jgi:hypothetical protein
VVFLPHIPPPPHQTSHSRKMITRYIASATIQFNPFTRAGRTARIFASLLPPDARATGVKVVTTVLPAATAGNAGGRVEVAFSVFIPFFFFFFFFFSTFPKLTVGGRGGNRGREAGEI